MKPFQSLLSDVWREASRFVELLDSTAAIARILGQHMPIDGVSIRRIDIPRCSVETTRIVLDSRQGQRQVMRAAYAANDMERLLANDMERLLGWCRRGAILLRRTEDSEVPEQALVVPPFMHGEVLAGALITDSGLLGIALLQALPSQCFEPVHQALFRSLLEPFARALENDRNLRQVTALRETAETDRSPLFPRLNHHHDGDPIIGAEGGLLPVLERVAMVIHSDVPVLILGETGAGKEVIARTIHSHSPRADGPFIRVNCGAIPLELVDSELFGHEKGSFTGAITTRRGWFERADTGTLFLDEIGELPAAAQVRLLRILQDGLFERVGGEQQIKVDVRIIAATHRDLATMVQSGQFREDLWYRIAVFPVQLPSLRERLQDIPALAEHFACRAAYRFGLPIRLPTPQDNAVLISYDWPGNVRELAAVMDRAVLLGRGRCLEVAKALGTASPGRPSPGNVAASPVLNQDVLNQQDELGIVPLDLAIKRHIERALVATQGRIEGSRGAAALLKINPHTLRARMRKLKIDWAKFR